MIRTLITIVGARPQFIKAAMVSRAFEKRQRQIGNGTDGLVERIVHTGQHYDPLMSQRFFDDLGIPAPVQHLGVGSGPQGEQTGRMLIEIERVLQRERPAAVLVYGDTNTTLAAALVAAKLHIPVAHVEGGMRSFNRRMPEEINRVVTDHVAYWNFCATPTAVENLAREGIASKVHLVGDVMHDAIRHFREESRSRSVIRATLGLVDESQRYALATIHRAENTDNLGRLQGILSALFHISETMPVVLPLHPRTALAIERAGERERLATSRRISVLGPISYLDMIQLEEGAAAILTDSGGVQKEAYWFGVPCITLRDETEWVETLASGFNRIAGSRCDSIVAAFGASLSAREGRELCRGEAPHAAEHIVDILYEEMR